MTSITQVSTNGLNLIKSFEGFSSTPYLDSVGISTIGYGATYYPGGTKVTLQDTPINESQACDLLANMLSTYEKSVDSFVVPEINQNQFDALVSFCYNIGAANLKISTLLKKVNINPNDPTIANEFVRWDKAGGNVLPGLLRRRQAESTLYFTPVDDSINS